MGKLPIKRPLLNYQRDYEPGLLDNKLVLPFAEQLLKVDSYILKAQVNPLRPLSISASLLNNEELNGVTARIEATLLEATSEIQQYCAENAWLSDIKRFTASFSRQQVCSVVDSNC